MKKLLSLFLGLAITFSLSACGEKKEETKSDKPTIKIGAILALSKNNALSGNTYKELYQMRLNEVSKNSKYEYKLIVEDDQFELAKSMLAAQKLLNVDKVDVLFTSASGAELGIVDSISKNKIIMFSPLWDDTVPKKSKYAFAQILLPNQLSVSLLSELQKKGVKSISIVAANHKGIIMAVEEVKKRAADYGVEILDVELANIENKDWAMTVAKMKEKNPDLYLSMFMPMGTETWGKELRRQGVSSDKVTSINMLDFITDKGLFEGSWYVTDGVLNSEFANKYRKYYGKDLEFPQAQWGYATLDWIVDIYESYDQKPTTDQVVNDLLSQKRDSIVGQISYDENGILRGKPILKIIRNGVAVPIEK